MKFDKTINIVTKIKEKYKILVLNKNINTLISFFKKHKTIISILILIIIATTLYTTLFLKLKQNNVYKLGPQNQAYDDRFYSYDDMHYAKEIFSKRADNLTIYSFSYVKHPLLVYGANTLTNIEYKIFPNLEFQTHYSIIIIGQIVVSLIGIIFLYLILVKIIKVNNIGAIILVLIYIFSNAIIISTLLAESFIYSSTLLIISYYCICKKNYIISGILGCLVMGITITNIIIWGIMVLFLIGFKDFKGLIKTTFWFLISSLIIMLYWIFFARHYFDSLTIKFLDVVLRNAEVFKRDYTIFNLIKNGFYFLLVSPFFYIDTINTDQNGKAINEAISFIPSSNLFITLFCIIVTIISLWLLINQFIKKSDKNILTCFLIVLFNIILHCGFKFGIHEAFIYTPHMFFAVIILLALLLKHYNKYIKYLYLVITIIFITQLITNFQSISDMSEVVEKLLSKT